MSQQTRRGISLSVVGLAALMIVLVTSTMHHVKANASVGRQSNRVFLPFANTPVQEAPTLLAPENGEVLGTLIPTFVWDIGTAAPGTYRWSCLVFSPNPDLLDFCNVEGLGSSGIQEWLSSWNLEPSTVYFWRVGTILNADYDDIRSSDVRRFTTADSGGPIPESPALVSPADGSNISPVEALLRWTAPTGAIQYQAIVDPNDGGGRYAWDSNDTELDLSGSVGPGASYEWYVSARNDYAWSDDSQAWIFTVSPSLITLGSVEWQPFAPTMRIIDRKIWIYQTE